MCKPYILAPTVCNFKRKLHFLFVTKLSSICLLQCSPFMSSLHYLWKFLKGFPHMLQNKSLFVVVLFFLLSMLLVTLVKWPFCWAQVSHKCLWPRKRRRPRLSLTLSWPGALSSLVQMPVLTCLYPDAPEVWPAGGRREPGGSSAVSQSRSLEYLLLRKKLFWHLLRQ